MKNVEVLTKRKGSAMVLALFAILLFMTMVVGFTYDSRSQSAYNAGFKLNAYYNQTARGILSQYGASALQEEWVEIPRTNDFAEMEKWRFGALLQSGGQEGKYGFLIAEDRQIFQNMGNLDLSYNIWVANNEDDPAVYLAGTMALRTPEKYIDATWDTDSKVVVTVEVFDNNDPDKLPKTTVSALFGPSGDTTTQGYLDVGNLGDPYGDVSNQGSDRALNPENLDAFR